jgi:hypothetical protein
MDDVKSFKLELVSEEELDNGDVLMRFDMDEMAIKFTSEIGLKMCLICGALDITIEEAFDTLLKTWPLEGEV